MRMAMGIIDSYGYSALIGVAGYHLFADFIGGRNENARQGPIATSRLVRIQNSQAADQPRPTGRLPIRCSRWAGKHRYVNGPAQSGRIVQAGRCRASVPPAGRGPRVGRSS